MRRHLTILVAEDDANDMMLLELAFAEGWSNARLHFVTGGEHAIDYLRGEHPFDNRDLYPLPALLLLDLKMPRVDGFEVLERLQKQPAAERPVIVVLSGSTRLADAERARALGADLCLKKPSDFRQLVQLVKNIRETCSTQFTLHASPALPGRS